MRRGVHHGTVNIAVFFHRSAPPAAAHLTLFPAPSPYASSRLLLRLLPSSVSGGRRGGKRSSRLLPSPTEGPFYPGGGLLL